MRVLLAHNRYRLPGGEERHVELLEEGLLEAGIEVRRFERDSSELDSSSAKRTAAALALAYRPGGGGIARIVEDWRPDVVHFHNLWPLLTPAALRLARRRGAAVVLTAHNYRFACPGGTLLRNGVVHDDCIRGSSLACGLRNPRGGLAESIAYGLALEVQRRRRMLERWVDAFIAPSAFMGRMLVESGLPSARVHVLSYGFPFAEQRESARSYVLFAGRLSEEKGVRTLLEAARIATDVPVAIAGSGPLADDVRSAPVAYLGQLRRPKVLDALASAAFSVVPSECYDNQPFAAVEAFSMGKPVVATSLGGLPELVQDGVTGLLVPARSPSELAQAMHTLWHSPELAVELGERALRFARENFSLRTQVKKTVALYEALRERAPGAAFA
jgi:glycosyltransferase involved in cell wall biosynthesis